MTIISDDSFSVISSLIQEPNFNHPNSTVATPNPNKRKRNLPRALDSDSEVIALSPESLMATNRFICEICKKGFQRDQNLQLHRRGHNLPWKLKRSNKESTAKKKVYVCPENTCAHHHPSRALGDLTGIKKHYSRKHGEKKLKCHKCSKKYAVLSDWKAHTKICGTREYKCHCGTIFSRKDSFNTHRAFCDAISNQATTIMPTQNLMMNLRADHHGIGNNYYDLIDNIPMTMNNIGLSNYWSTSLASASPALMLKEEEYCKGISSNTLRAAESCYYFGINEEGGTITTSNFMSSLLQKAVQMGSISTTTTTTNNNSGNHTFSSIFCNGSMGDEEENLNLLTASNNMMMMGSNGNKNIINGFVFDIGADGRNPFHEAAAVDTSTTRDFLGSGGWSTFDMAKFGSLAPSSSSALSGGGH